jgi:hypothetical protein
VSTDRIRALVAAQLGKVKDPGRRAAIAALLTPPERRTFAWNYGEEDQRYDVWVIGKTPDGSRLLAYAEEGFGPGMPWGVVVSAEDSMGMDSQWHFDLEHAVLNFRLIDPDAP